MINCAGGKTFVCKNFIGHEKCSGNFYKLIYFIKKSPITDLYRDILFEVVALINEGMLSESYVERIIG